MDSGKSFLVRWSNFFIKKYRITILLLLAIIIAGVWGVTSNQRQDFPTIPLNFVYVSAIYPGASPADVEREVITPIEQLASGLDNVERVRSSAQNSYGDLQVFVDDVTATDSTSAKLTNEIAKLGLPSDADVSIQTFDATGPSLALGIVGTDGQSTTDLLQYAGVIQARLEASSAEIKRVEISPSNEYEISIVLDVEKLAQSKLSVDQITGAIRSQIASLPGGTVETDDGLEKSITIQPATSSLEEMKSIPIGQVTLADIATIQRLPVNNDTVTYVGYVKDGTGYAKESVYLLVYKKNDGDIIRISEAVHEEIQKIKTEATVPESVDIVTGYDISPYIQNQLDSLLNNGYLGLVLILIVLLFFINLRTAVVVALVIPVVFLASLFVLNVIGFSLNILTLFAMILTLGILVDNAIVIAEGMVHELEKGKTRLQASLASVQKLGPAVTAATLTTIVVFIPFASLGGIIGDFLKYIPFTIMIILALSFFTAVSITPLFGTWMLREETYEQRRQKKIKLWEKALILPAVVHYGQNIIDRLSLGYKHVMSAIYKKWSLKLTVILVTTILFGISFGYFAPQLAFEQFPSQDSTTMQVDFDFPVGTPQQEKNKIFIAVQNELITLPYFKTFYAFGNTIYGTFTEPVDRTDDTTIFDLSDSLNSRLGETRNSAPQGTVINVAATSYGPPQSQYDITVELLDNNRDVLMNASDDLAEYLQSLDGVALFENGPRAELVPSIQIDLDQQKLNTQGVNALAAAGTVNTVFSPQKIGTVVVSENGLSDDVTVSFSSSATDSLVDLQNLLVPSVLQGLTTLSSVATIEEVQLPVSIKRLDSRRVATINVKAKDDADIAAINQNIQDYLSSDKLKELGLAEDAVQFGGEFSEFDSDFSNLQIIFLLAMLGVYLILVYQFQSYYQPLMILFAVPLALIGVFPGLHIVGSSLNMISGLGIVALVGIVVNDAIVFVTTYNRYRVEFPEETISETLVRAGHSRFKPIFSTSITTIGGVLPLTILDPFWTGLGTSIVSGLIFSTVGTLIAIPVLFSIFNSIGKGLRKKFRKQTTESQS